MEVIIMAAQLLLGISILVGMHELGHLLAAKAFGMRVEKFSIGFPPKIWGFQWGETEYSIGAVPLGGFVKITGMIDESLDTENLKKDPEPWEFRAKPAWQRLIVMLGGITVNVIVGIVIFIFMVGILGEPYISKDVVNSNGGIYVSPIGEELGLKRGDQVVEVNGKDFDNFGDVGNINFMIQDGSSYTVVRNGERMKIAIPADFLNKLSDMPDNERSFVEPLLPFKIGMVEPGKPAHAAGLQEEDSILAINDFPIKYFQDFKQALSEHKEDTISLKIWRAGQVQDVNVGVMADGRIGFQMKPTLPSSTLEYSLGGAMTRGTVKAFEVIALQLQAFKKIFKREVNAVDSLSGPLGIAKIYGPKWDWVRFWNITAMISMVLAFMNLLPIPALDGGHVVFLSYEIISGRAPSDKFLENAQKVGMVILLMLMAFAFGSDIYKFFFK